MIPVYRPLFLGNEKKYLNDCIDNSEVSSSGCYVRKFESAFSHKIGCEYGIAVSSGTSALETALWACGIRPGDEVIIPAYTIISCAIAVYRIGAKPVFVDMGEDLCMKADNLPLTSKTRAVMPVHLFGNRCNMDRIIHIAQDCNLSVIEDCSQYWGEPHPETDVAIYSLYANKIITSGEGGILVTNNKNINRKARKYRDLCHSSQRFVHYHLGANYRMSNMQGAVALAQLEEVDKYVEIKKTNLGHYQKYLPGKVKYVGGKVPWMYIVKLEDGFSAKKVIEALWIKAIECRPFFYPLPLQPCIHSYQLFENKSDKYFYLPSGLDLTEKDIKYICDSLSLTLDTMT